MSQAAWGGAIIDVTIPDAGIVYFDDLAELHRKQFLRWLYGFLTGFASGVVTSVIGSFIFQWLTTQ